MAFVRPAPEEDDRDDEDEQATERRATVGAWLFVEALEALRRLARGE